jgi:hypothetical protein
MIKWLGENGEELVAYVFFLGNIVLKRDTNFL